MNKHTELYQYYESVTAQAVEWLWYPYIPYGKITLLQGDPGDGKSTFILNVAAILTTGRSFPDGYKTSEISTVIYQCSEDNYADTVKPRLLHANADCSKVAFIMDEERVLDLKDERIEKVLVSTKARLLILDPIQSFIPPDADMQSAAKMRSVLGRLNNLAEKNNCAIVLVGHMNKSNKGKNLYRGLGSIDIAAIARSVLMIGKDAKNPEIRYMFPIKSSLSPEGSAIGFMMDPQVGFRWIGKCNIDINALQISANRHKRSKRDNVKNLLQILLSEADMPSKEILKRMEQLGVCNKTVRLAKEEMNIKAYRKKQVWYWALPEEETSNES